MNMYSFIRRFAVGTLMLGLLGAAGLALPQTARAACSPLPTANGTASFTVTVPADGDYRFWAHIYAPAAGTSGLYLQIDDAHCGFNLGDSKDAPAGQFTWVDYQKGTPSDKITVNLSAGTHTIQLAGLDPGASADKVMLLAGTDCVPTGDGNNCASGAASSSNPTATEETNKETSPTAKTTPSTQDTSKRLWWLVIPGLLLLTGAVFCGLWLFQPARIHWLLDRIHRTFNKAALVDPNQPAPVGPVTPHTIPHHHRWWMITLMIVLAVVGSALVIRSVSAGSQVSFLVVDATLAHGATVVANEKAINSKAVQFGTAPAGSNTSGSSGGGSSSSSSGGGSSSNGGGGTSTPSSGQSCPAYPAFPDANCTGVPSGVSLSTYSGPCTITANGTVIDGKTVNCSLEITATNVVIKNSKINGTVYTPNGSLAYSFSITDSEVIAPQAAALEQTGIGEANFTALRVEVTGGNRSIYCRKNCTVTDSWVHGQNIADSPRVHASGIRQSQGATIVHNRIHCSADDTSSGGGCSANLTGYGDFEPVQDNRIEKNLFVATPAGACAYGGSSGDDGSKPYGHLASNIVFIDNIFQRGSVNNCGFYFPITDFDDSRPGNQWTNNKWEDGAVLPPAN